MYEGMQGFCRSMLINGRLNYQAEFGPSRIVRNEEEKKETISVKLINFFMNKYTIFYIIIGLSICLYVGGFSLKLAPLTIELPKLQNTIEALVMMLLIEINNFTSYKRGYMNGQRNAKKVFFDAIQRVKRSSEQQG